MDYLVFRQLLSSTPVFSTQQVYLLLPDFSRHNLINWTKKGYITPLRRGWYCFSDRAKDEGSLYLIANRMVTPSYVTMQSALSWYALIPEGVFTIMSVTTRKTRTYENDFGVFKYHALSEQRFLGYDIVSLSGQYVHLATVEKALIDMLYFNPGLDTWHGLDALRLDNQKLQTLFDHEMFAVYAKQMQGERLTKRLQGFVKRVDLFNEWYQEYA